MIRTDVLSSIPMNNENLGVYLINKIPTLTYASDLLIVMTSLPNISCAALMGVNVSADLQE